MRQQMGKHLAESRAKIRRPAKVRLLIHSSPKPAAERSLPGLAPEQGCACITPKASPGSRVWFLGKTRCYLQRCWAPKQGGCECCWAGPGQSGELSMWTGQDTGRNNGHHPLSRLTSPQSPRRAGIIGICVSWRGSCGSQGRRDLPWPHQE